MGSSTPSGTTFVQAQPDTFRDLVQRLTGPAPSPPPPCSADRRHSPSPSPVPPPSPPIPAPARPLIPACGRRGGAAPTRLHERKRASSKYAALAVSTSNPTLPTPAVSPASSVCPSPSTVFAGLSVSDDRWVDASAFHNTEYEYEDVQEELAVREKRFYIRSSPSPSPRNRPQLLALFPVSSPTSSAEN